MKQRLCEANMALFKPKKDQCNICTGYNVGNVEEIDYQEHVQKKQEARSEKKRDNELSQNDEKTVVNSYMLICKRLC